MLYLNIYEIWKTKPTVKPKINDTKVMLCIWWDPKVMLYYKLLKPCEIINGERYRHQHCLITEKRPQLATRTEVKNVYYDNARPLVARRVKNYQKDAMLWIDNTTVHAYLK